MAALTRKLPGSVSPARSGGASRGVYRSLRPVLRRRAVNGRRRLPMSVLFESCFFRRSYLVPVYATAPALMYVGLLML